MPGLRTLRRTAVFAWSPSPSTPSLLATGTRTGAVSDDFDDSTKLELWDLRLNDISHNEDDLTPIATLTTDAGFNDISWSGPVEGYSLGLIAGALENGSVDIWDVAKLKEGEGESGARVVRTTKHSGSGSVRALQWNSFRSSMLASVGSKGEIYLYDFSSSASSPSTFRLGASAARADDIECLDWNKQEKTQHILATGSSGGSVTVWDVKQKRDILTLNTPKRNAVSAVAWDPEESTKLATASSNDGDPAVHLWSLRNASAPERTLQGHELGVLGLSWCVQEPELLLSCGKDNQTLCWNARTGEKYGGFAAGSNWAFQSVWHPRNPGLIASASFDGKILVTGTQATNEQKNEDDRAANTQALDGEDFFAKAQTQPQGISFSIPKAPRYLSRPVSVGWGFGGKLVRVSTSAKTKKSSVKIESFAVDSSIGESAKAFDDKLQSGDLAGICEAKVEEAKTEEEKADWRVIETMNAGKSRKKLREYIGFADSDSSVDDLAAKTGKLDVNGDAETNGDKVGEKSDDEDDDDFFGKASTSKDDGDDSFLAKLDGAKSSKPFSLSSSNDLETDKRITRALMLGDFTSALDACLKEEDRMADAFMIAVCGGQACIDKAQAAYLSRRQKQDNAPAYLRLLASVVGKDLWDIVRNAEVGGWKEAMATVCTYADEKEFADLCEALGDRLEEAADGEDKAARRDASFCYLAGSNLQKVVVNWVQELREQESAALESSDEEGDEFAVHAKCLQSFVEKVSVFRKITNFRDPAEKGANGEWKLGSLYALYTEYADILASQGQLASAEAYLAFLPKEFEGAEGAQQRVRQATATGSAAKKSAVPGAAAARQPATGTAGQRQGSVAQQAGGGLARPPSVFQPQPPLVSQARNATPGPYTPIGATPHKHIAPPPPPDGRANLAYAPTQQQQASQNHNPNPYAPPAQQQAGQNPYAPPANSYAPSGPSYGGYQPPAQQAPLPPPPRAGGAASPATLRPAAQSKKEGDWNDMPANFFPAKPAGSRRGTPAPPGVVASPFPNAQPGMGMSPPPPGQQPGPYAQAPPQRAPLPPPPKAGERVLSPPPAQPQSHMQRPLSRASNAYAPPQGSQPSTPGLGSTFPPPSAAPPVARGASPYQPPPATSHAAPSNRYAPAPGSTPSQAPGAPLQQRQVAPNPYSQPGTPYGQPQQVEGQVGRGGQYAPSPAQQTPYGQPPQQGQLGQYGQPPQQGQYGQPPPQQQAPPPSSTAGPPPRGPPKAAQAPPIRGGPAPPVQPLPQTASDAPPENRPPPVQSQKAKYPRGDRSHIPASAQPIVDILTPELQRIKGVAPQAFKPQVEDMEKRVNILFDHLNNEDLLSEGTVQRLVGIAEQVRGGDWEGAGKALAALQGALAEGEGGVWVAGVKRLINIGKATSGR